MTDLIICGILGKMGRAVAELAQTDDFNVVAGVDVTASELRRIPVYKGFDSVPNADVVIDFSAASNLSNVLAYCIKCGAAAVLCATGYTERDLAAIEEASRTVAVFKTANLSIGINLLQKLAREAADFLIEIMPVMFIPAAAGLLDAWPVLQAIWIPVILITVVTTVLVMVVTGRVTQHMIRRKDRKEHDHAELPD